MTTSPLETGRFYEFSAWPNPDLPRVAIGCYSIWHKAQFIYVGVAGRSLTPAQVAESPKQDNRPKGLYDRLNSHASGRRSGDQFCVYVCDRLVLPVLSRKEIEEVAAGERSLDSLTKAFIRDHLSYRFVETPTYKDALAIERAGRYGAFDAGLPLLNPRSD